MPAAKAAVWSAAVPELTATACRAPTTAATACSNAGTRGPVVSQSERSAATTACTSSSAIPCLPYGRSVARTGRPPWIASASVTRQLLHLVEREPDVIGIARVAEAARRPLATLPGLEVPRRGVRLDDEHVVALEHLAALVLGDEALVELLPGPDADVVDRAPGRHRGHEVHDAHARNLRHEDLAAPHQLRAADGEVDALGERDPEAGHRPIGHGHAPRRPLRREERDHAAAAPDDVAVAHDAEHGSPRVAVDVALDEKLLAAQLGGAVQIDRVDRLVRADPDDALDALVDGGVDDVLRPEHIGLDRLERVVLARGNLLHRGGVEDDVHPVHGALEALAIAHVADEEAERRMAHARGHLGLLQLVAAEHHEPPRVVSRQHDLDELVAERARAPGDQDGRLPPVHRASFDRSHDPPRCAYR